MHRGYVKLWRKVSDNPLWTEEKFTRGQAWIDMIMLANHKDGHIRVRGIKVPVKRGECGWSVVKLAERWKWSRGKTQRFLNELETVQQIVQQKNLVTSLFTIVNYADYQENGTTKRTASDTANGQQTDTNKNVKNEKNNPPAPQRVNGSVLKVYDYPDWLDMDQWNQFHKMRSKIKKPITTDQTIKRLMNGLKKLIDAGYTQEQLFANAIDGCWQKFYEPKENPFNQPKTNHLPEITDSPYGN